METIHRTFLLLGQPYATFPVPGHKTWPRNRNPLPAKIESHKKQIRPLFSLFKGQYKNLVSHDLLYQFSLQELYYYTILGFQISN